MARTRSDTTRQLCGLRVLAIDDDEAVRLGMQALLQSWGCLVLPAARAQADGAIHSAHARPPDLIITDYRLRHEETGKEALQALRAHLG